MTKPHRMCVNCSVVYPDRLRKCPNRRCRAPKRFSCEEPAEYLRIRTEIAEAQSAAFEALLQEFAADREAQA